MEKLIIFYVLICNILGARYRFNQCASNHFECIKYQIATQFTRIFERSDIVNDWIFKLNQSTSELNSTAIQHKDIINDTQLVIASIVSQQEDIENWRDIVDIFMTASEEKIDQLQEKVNDFESTLSRIRVNINECFSSPCQNGGVCNVGVNQYTCNCVTGFAGTNCELNINECSSSPCQHGGVCNDGVGQYTCDCAMGFAGPNCEHNVTICNENVLNEVGKCFWIPMGNYNYREGEALCAQYNGHAGHVKTEEINVSLKRQLDWQLWTWIGLLRGPEGWMWSDGDLATWQHWNLNGNGDCAAYTIFGWVARECSMRRKMLCEIDLG